MERPAVKTPWSGAPARRPTVTFPKVLAGGARPMAVPRVAGVRQEGAGPRGPAALTWASPNKGDRGPCGSPAFRRAAPEHGTEPRVSTGPRCLPRTRAKSGGPGHKARTPPNHTSSHLGSKERSPYTGSPRLLGPRVPPGPSSECQVPIHRCSKAHRPLATLGEGADSPRAAPLRRDPVLVA